MSCSKVKGTPGCQLTMTSPTLDMGLEVPHLSNNRTSLPMAVSPDDGRTLQGPAPRHGQRGVSPALSSSETGGGQTFCTIDSAHASVSTWLS